MAITNNDVKLFESQRLTDEDEDEDEEDGGGRVTGNEVIDGNVNNLFQDISRWRQAKPENVGGSMN